MMSAEHKLLLALSEILKPLHPHLEPLHAEVERSAGVHRAPAPPADVAEEHKEPASAEAEGE